jgi:pimeloyl-ACP methyl ester carboxylesterase
VWVVLLVGVTGCGGSSRHAFTNGIVGVHGQRFAVHCRGAGSPTVVLEAGLGFGAAEWAGVQSKVATRTRTCAYDRLGEGESSPIRPGIVQTVADQARTLVAVLDAAGLKPPYVLVGHSWGGAIVQRFAFDHRSQVAAIVLVESSSQNDDLRKSLAILPRKKLLVGDPIANVRAGLTRALNKPSANPEHVDTKASIPQLQQLRTLGALPLIVLTAGQSDITTGLPPRYAEPIQAIWLHAQEQLSHLSTNSVHAIVENSGHLIPIYQPQAVVAAVIAAVLAARHHGTLGSCRAIFRHLTNIRCL